MKPLTKKQIDKLVEAAFNEHGKGIQFNIMDLGKIANAGRQAAAEGRDIVEAVKAAIAQYRQN